MRSLLAQRGRQCASIFSPFIAKVRESRLFVALHMHAGDGNVHTNIPVHSADYAMLHEAERIVARIMALATAARRRHLR